MAGARASFVRFAELLRRLGALSACDQAIAAVRPFRDSHPVEARKVLKSAHASRANTREAQGRYLAAAVEWQDAVDNSLTFDIPYYGLRRAHALLLAGRTTQALAAVDRIVAADPETHLEHGHPLYQAAAIYAEATRRVKPSEPRRSCDLVDQARTLFGRARALAPDDEPRLRARAEMAAAFLEFGGSTEPRSGE